MQSIINTGIMSVTDPAFFQKAGGDGRGKAPSSPSAEGETPPNDPKRSGRAAKTSRWDVLAKGNPIKGFPAGRSPAPPAHQTKPAPVREP